MEPQGRSLSLLLDRQVRDTSPKAALSCPKRNQTSFSWIYDRRPLLWGDFNIVRLCHGGGGGECCQVVDNHQPAHELKEPPPPLRHPGSQHLEHVPLVFRADLYLESFKTCPFLLRGPICAREQSQSKQDIAMCCLYPT